MTKILEEKAITLIALVVTIIVLLILAGITITLLIGENGILSRVNEATLKTELAQMQEKINLDYVDHSIDSLTGNGNVSSMIELRKKGIIDEDNIINTKKLLGEKSKYGNGSNKDIYIIENARIYYIDKHGNYTESVDILLQKDPLITEWTVNANDKIILPISIGYKGDNDFVVNWGDGSPTEVVNDRKEVLSKRPEHVYTEAGTYQVSIEGRCSYFATSAIDEYPEILGKLTKLVSWGTVESSRYEFANAVNLSGSIPKPSIDTFINVKNNNFKHLFYECANLTGPIPEGLFDNISEGIYTFKNVFYKCSGLTEIPENLFANAPNATEFNKAFYRCTGITKIPEKLFANNTKITDMYMTFYKCTNIEAIPITLLDAATNIVNLGSTFEGLEKVTTVPELWKRTTPGLDGTGCFNGCTAVTQTIPAPWKE